MLGTMYACALRRTAEVADEIFLLILLNFLKSFRSFSAAPRREGE